MTTTSETQLISCPSCGAPNRVRPADQQNLEPVCGRCKTLLVAVGPVTVTDANFNQEVEQSRLPVLLDMWAPWCPPCRMIAPIIEELASDLAGRVRVGKLNTDENQQTASRFGVRSIPTLLVLKDGVEIERLVGAHPKDEILRRLGPLIE
jgi:thioredoxin 2